MKDADLEYLRNVNTRPGPGAGRSIDPSKPGPDDALAQSDAEPARGALEAIQRAWRTASPEIKGQHPSQFKAFASGYRAANLAQSDAEPVAWQLVPKEPTVEMVDAAFNEVELSPNASPHYPNNEARRLIYKAMLSAAPAPPRPDASAGLIEAAQMADEQANEWCVNDDIYFAYQEFAKKLRSRAADRSRK